MTKHTAHLHYYQSVKGSWR